MDGKFAKVAFTATGDHYRRLITTPVPISSETFRVSLYCLSNARIFSRLSGSMSSPYERVLIINTTAIVS